MIVNYNDSSTYHNVFTYSFVKDTFNERDWYFPRLRYTNKIPPEGLVGPSAETNGMPGKAAVFSNQVVPCIAFYRKPLILKGVDPIDKVYTLDFKSELTTSSGYKYKFINYIGVGYNFFGKSDIGGWKDDELSDDLFGWDGKVHWNGRALTPGYVDAYLSFETQDTKVEDVSQLIRTNRGFRWWKRIEAWSLDGYDTSYQVALERADRERSGNYFYSGYGTADSIDHIFESIRPSNDELGINGNTLSLFSSFPEYGEIPFGEGNQARPITVGGSGNTDDSWARFPSLKVYSNVYPLECSLVDKSTATYTFSINPWICVNRRGVLIAKPWTFILTCCKGYNIRSSYTEPYWNLYLLTYIGVEPV